MMHLTLYLLRRIVYAACLVFWHEWVKIGIGLLMLSSLLMIFILWRDNQWWEQEIRTQHIVNEITLYVICIQLLVFVDIYNRITALGHLINGVLLVLLVLGNIVYNINVIIRYAYERYKLYWTRRKNLIEYRKTRKSVIVKNEETLAHYDQLQTMLAQESKKTWKEQWAKMCE